MRPVELEREARQELGGDRDLVPLVPEARPRPAALHQERAPLVVPREQPNRAAALVEGEGVHLELGLEVPVGIHFQHCVTCRDDERCLRFQRFLEHEAPPGGALLCDLLEIVHSDSVSRDGHRVPNLSAGRARGRAHANLALLRARRERGGRREARQGSADRARARRGRGRKDRRWGGRLHVRHDRARRGASPDGRRDGRRRSPDAPPPRDPARSDAQGDRRRPRVGRASRHALRLGGRYLPPLRLRAGVDLRRHLAPTGQRVLL